MKKILFFIIFLLLVIGGYFGYDKAKKLLPFYAQLTQTRVGVAVDLQDKAQQKAHYVGSAKCMECHKKHYKQWSHSQHPRMIQDIHKNPKVVVGDFASLPKDADFTLQEAIYTIGGKFKQRYMIPQDINGTKDYRIGNYQWNSQIHTWQPYKSWKDWYGAAYPHDNFQVPTSKTCDGCHFTGYMSRQKRVELGTTCESCHGPASEHVKNPKSNLFVASLADPVRQNEVCLQCHMRDRDYRLKDHNISALYNDAVDYPKGYEPGKSLAKYKMPTPFQMGHEMSKFYANGAAKHNRSQGNEFVRSMMAKHGITCINCHNPHTLEPTAQHNTGNKLCMKCHTFGSLIGPHEPSLAAHTHHKANSSGSLCVECHMPKVGHHSPHTPFTVRSHLFAFTTPAQTLKFGMPKGTNACYACHQDKSLKTLQGDLEKWGMVGWDKR